MSVFQVGGLASGLDTQSIIEALVAAERRPIDLLERRKDQIASQISSIGSLLSRLSSFRTASSDLRIGGVLAASAMRENTAFSVTTSNRANPGTYDITVESLAKAARAQSLGFDASDSLVSLGDPESDDPDLRIVIDGKNYDFAKQDESGNALTISQLAQNIRNSDAPVTAEVVFTGTAHHLIISRPDAGHEIGKDPSTGLQILETSVVDPEGQTLGFAITNATNAKIDIDGLSFERRSNSITNAIPGVTLTLDVAGGPAESLVIARDSEGTADRIRKFIDAYNDIIDEIKPHIDINQDTNRNRTLAGDSAVQSLQRRLQSLTTAQVHDSGSVRSLVDMGISTGADGKLKLDSARLDAAIERDPSAVDNMFSKSKTGLAALTDSLHRDYADIVDGILVGRRNSLNRTTKEMTADIERMEARIDTRRETLLSQFTAMEKMVAELQSMGSFLEGQVGIW